MVQEVGETRDAILEDVQKMFNDILDANKDRKSPYWIVIFAKPEKKLFKGLPALRQHIKAYSTKPQSQVGMIVAEVNNSKGISWEINQPQKPFDFDMLQLFGADPCDEVVTETTTIPWAYVTK